MAVNVWFNNISTTVNSKLSRMKLNEERKKVDRKFSFLFFTFFSSFLVHFYFTFSQADFACKNSSHSLANYNPFYNVVIFYCHCVFSILSRGTIFFSQFPLCTCGQRNECSLNKNYKNITF